MVPGVIPVERHSKWREGTLGHLWGGHADLGLARPPLKELPQDRDPCPHHGETEAQEGVGGGRAPAKCSQTNRRPRNQGPQPTHGGDKLG